MATWIAEDSLMPLRDSTNRNSHRGTTPKIASCQADKWTTTRPGNTSLWGLGLPRSMRLASALRMAKTCHLLDEHCAPFYLHPISHSSVIMIYSSARRGDGAHFLAHLYVLPFVHRPVKPFFFFNGTCTMKSMIEGRMLLLRGHVRT